jgi:hypothetical protein
VAPRSTALAVASVLLYVAHPARAIGPVDLEVAAQGGAATSPGSSAFGGVSPLGFGLGARVGAAWENVYLGLSLAYYLGNSGRTSGGQESAHTFLEGGEVGYTFRFPAFFIRPVAGAGTAAISTSYDGFTGTQNNFYLHPSVELVFPFSFFFVGADAGALILPAFEHAVPGSLSGASSTYVSVTGHGELGVRF